MSLKECYNAFGGNYDNVLSRLGSEKIVEKFMLRFPDDDNFITLAEALDYNNTEVAFRAAHTLKGITQNLSFDTLFYSVNSVTEALRNGNSEKAIKLFPKLAADYVRTVSNIVKYKS